MSACPNKPLLIGDRGATGAIEMEHLVVSEARFLASTPEVSSCVVKGIAILNQHIEGHHQPLSIGSTCSSLAESS
ncbi:MAG: hypothetical protein ACKO24_08425 [Leptolyngbyaceae cyanobacterium]